MKNKTNEPKINLTGAVSFIARSGTGKTTLIEKVIRILAERGYRVSSIKHTDHDFEADKPGKDSYRHKKAGTFSTMLLSENKMAFFSDSGSGGDIRGLLPLYFKDSDILIVEGFRDLDIPKIELFRKEINHPGELRYLNDPTLVLVCGDEKIEGIDIPQININDFTAVADFIEKKFILNKKKKNLDKKL